MTITKTVTQLDFDQLKSEIITFIKGNPAFSDYNFEGSALNAIVDVLAYNTHNNAYYANMVHNEGFIDSAQKRSSVVSRAKELGYVPKSATCSTAYVDVSVFNVTTPSNVSLLMPRGTSFNSNNDIGSYLFYVVDDVYSSTDGNFKFTNIKICNGQPTKNFFKVNTQSNIRSIFTIPNKSVDISTLKVFVRDSIASVDRTEYFQSKNVYGLDPTSRVFFVQESYDGSYQIYFGGDVLGKQPVTGNIVDVDYFVVENYSNSDLCKNFTFQGTIGMSSDVGVVTVQQAFGGSDKEPIDSVKYNAIKSNSAKGRSVTINDYSLLLKEKFNFIKSVSVWGGEDNVPPVYGKVFISLQPNSGFTISESVKKNVILPAIKSASMLTITPEFVDPTYICIDFVTRIKFNPMKTMTTQFDTEALIQSIVVNYIASISYFNYDYLESKLASDILQADPGIVSVDVDKRVGFRLTPLIGVETTFVKNLGNAILPGTVGSNKFNIIKDGVVFSVTIKEIPNRVVTSVNAYGNAESLQYLGYYSESNILIKEIGTVNITTGQLNLFLNVYSYPTDSRAISIRCEVVQDDMSVLRNHIIVLDNEISNNNIVFTEIYGK